MSRWFSPGAPSTPRVLPREGHSLTDNPWRGKIKVREELAGLDKDAR